MRQPPTFDSIDLFADPAGRQGGTRSEVIENRLIGLRQESDGTTSLCPLEHLLLLRGARNVAPGSVPLARLARGLIESAADWLKSDALSRMVDEHRAQIQMTLPERLDWMTRGYDHKTAELIARRQRVSEEARRGDARAKAELTKVKDQQRQHAADKERRLALLKAEPSLIVAGDATIVAHALVLPTDDPEERRRHDAEVEAIAVRLAQVHEESAGAIVHDVSRPDLARRAGLTDWPGFDLRSLRPASAHGLAEDRAIEVKGRAGSGGVEVSENEWAKACNLRDCYLALRRLRLRHAPAAPRESARSVRQAARQGQGQRPDCRFRDPNGCHGLRDHMKICYVDESGNSPKDDPCLVMVGILVDAYRLNRTREEFIDIFDEIQSLFEENLRELKGSKMIFGRDRWRKVDPEVRKRIAGYLCNWIADRKHYLALSAIDRGKLKEDKTADVPNQCRDEWLAGGLHIALQIQKANQGQGKNKGHTVLIFDDNKAKADTLSD